MSDETTTTAGWTDLTTNTITTHSNTWVEFPHLRSRGAQLLRDAALGAPEFGPEMGDVSRIEPNSDWFTMTTDTTGFSIGTDAVTNTVTFSDNYCSNVTWSFIDNE